MLKGVFPAPYQPVTVTTAFFKSLPTVVLPIIAVSVIVLPAVAVSVIVLPVIVVTVAVLPIIVVTAGELPMVAGCVVGFHAFGFTFGAPQCVCRKRWRAS